MKAKSPCPGFLAPKFLIFLLAFSLLVNVGVFAAVAWRSLTVTETAPSLPQHLGLDARQLREWHAAEADFLARLAGGADAVRAHRDRMIAGIFSDAPDLARIDAERAAISRLQDEQQRLVVAQLLRERELLDATQRERLARLLMAQPVGPSAFERLHRD
ncbi:MAG: periplasmic heavy metal sensor [Azospira sp.]|jgi:hypothetical protein|nr:periplasmic heavy metal sensor [Azospira sp.]